MNGFAAELRRTAVQHGRVRRAVFGKRYGGNSVSRSARAPATGAWCQGALSPSGRGVVRQQLLARLKPEGQVEIVHAPPNARVERDAQLRLVFVKQREPVVADAAWQAECPCRSAETSRSRGKSGSARCAAPCSSEVRLRFAVGHRNAALVDDVVVFFLDFHKRLGIGTRRAVGTQAQLLLVRRTVERSGGRAGNPACRNRCCRDWSIPRTGRAPSAPQTPWQARCTAAA